MNMISQIVYQLRLKISKDNLNKRLGKAAFWSIAGAVSQKVLILLTSFICIYILGRNDYGKLSIIRSTIQLFIVLGSVGLGSTATKYIADFRNSDLKRLKSIYSIVNLIGTVTGGLATLLICFFSGALASYLKDPSLSSSIQFGAVLIFFSVITSVQTGILTGFEKFEKIAIISVWGGVAEFICINLGAYFFSVKGALSGYTLGFIIMALLNHIAIQNEMKGKGVHFSFHHIDRTDLKILVNFSIPLMCSGLIVSPVFYFAQTLLTRFVGFAEFAVYAAADQWRIVILFLPSALSRIVLPILSNLNSSNQGDQFKRVLKINLLLNGGLSLLVFLGVAAFLPVVLYFYRFQSSAVMPFLILGGSSIGASLALVVGQAIVSKAKIWVGLSFNILWGIQVILYEWILLKHGFGINSLPIAMFTAYFIHAALMLLYLNRQTKSTKK